MSGSHPALATFLAGDSAGEERRRVVAHLRRCATCRAEVAAEDPTKLFAVLGAEPVPPHVLERLQSSVTTAIEPDPRPVRVRWTAGLAAAAALVAVLYGAGQLRRPGSAGPFEPVAPKVVQALPVMPAMELSAGFELQESAGEEARVVDLAVGDVQLVMIFDRELDL